MTRRARLSCLVFAMAAAVSWAGCGSGRAPNENITNNSGSGDAGLDGGGASDSCQVKYDCPPGDICSLTHCQTPPANCHTDAECPAGLICGSGGICRSGCSDHRDCLAPQLCDPVRAVCDVCSLANPCPSGETCLAGACRPMTECHTTSDCVATNDGEICVNGTCSPCATDADCNVTPYNSEQRRCQRGICSPPAIDAGPGTDAGMSCHSKYECPAGAICKSQVCQQPSGVCATNADCPIGRICQNGSSCVPGCADARDCGPGQTCQGGMCQMSGCNQQACAQQCGSQGLQCDPQTCTCMNTGCDVNVCNQQCAVQGGQCDPGTCSCTQSCNVNACNQQCGAQGLSCNSSTCACSSPMGGQCASNSDCGSTDVCANGNCAEQALSGPGGSGCSLIQCLLGAYGVGSPCVGATSGMNCSCQSSLAGLGSGNFSGPFACQ